MSDGDDQGFAIRDRRRFDADGNVREEAEERDDQPADAAWESEQVGDSADGEMPPIDFSTFVLSLSTSAMVHLGEGPAPEGAIRKNLPMARHVIDILGMLRDKTKGNLSDDEAQLIEKLLYDLRIRYVQAAG